MTVLAQLRELGATVEQRWRRDGFAEEALAKIALNALTDIPAVTVAELVDEVLSLSLPKQFAIASDFGDPPVTVYQSDHLVVDVCFWAQPRTAIHSHNFTGAFSVLHGTSLHTRYTFDVDESDADEVLLGRLRAVSSELLHEGDVREISAGLGFVHQVCHLAAPSVSVVVRTAQPSPGNHVYSFHGDRLAVGQAAAGDGESQIRHLQLVGTLAATRGSEFAHLVARVAQTRSPAERFELLTPFASLLSEDAWNDMLASLGSATSSWMHALGVFGRSVTQPPVHWRRVDDEAHRFWLCLLMSGVSASVMKEVVRQYTGDDDFARQAMTWTVECCDAGVLPFELNAVAREILRGCFEGLSVADIEARLLARFKGADATVVQRDVGMFLDALRQTQLFDVFLPA